MSFSLQSFMIVFSTFSCIVILLCFSYRKIFYNLLSSFKLLSIKRRVSKTLNQGSLGPQGPWLIMHLNLLFIWVCLNRCDICKSLYINIYRILRLSCMNYSFGLNYHPNRVFIPFIQLF